MAITRSGVWTAIVCKSTPWTMFVESVEVVVCVCPSSFSILVTVTVEVCVDEEYCVTTVSMSVCPTFIPTRLRSS